MRRPSVTVQHLEVLALQPDWSLTIPPIPSPTVVAGATEIPSALALVAAPDTGQAVGPRRPVTAMRATVTDSLGRPLVGVPVTFTAGGPGVLFSSCGCGSITVVSRTSGAVSSGRAVASSATGRVVVTASTADAATQPATYTVDVGGRSGP